MQEGKIFRLSNLFFELTKGIIVFLIVLALLHFFVATIFKVEGISMEPNFHKDQYLLVNKISYITSNPERGDVIVLNFPGDPAKTKYIKRLIGLPGDKVTIKEEGVFVNDIKLNEYYLPEKTITTPYMEVNLKQDEYFAVGDNRLNSSDSRTWGIVPKKYIIGKATFFLFPFSAWGYIPKVFY